MNCSYIITLSSFIVKVQSIAPWSYLEVSHSNPSSKVRKISIFLSPWFFWFFVFVFVFCFSGHVLDRDDGGRVAKKPIGPKRSSSTEPDGVKGPEWSPVLCLCLTRLVMKPFPRQFARRKSRFGGRGGEQRA